MEFTPFGVSSRVKKQTGALRTTPIAEFAEPLSDQLEETLQPASPTQRETEADQLQVRERKAYPSLVLYISRCVVRAVPASRTYNTSFWRIAGLWI